MADERPTDKGMGWMRDKRVQAARSLHMHTFGHACGLSGSELTTCICIYIYIYVYVYVRVYRNVCMYVRRIHVYTHREDLHINIYIYIHINICMYVCMCV